MVAYHFPPAAFSSGVHRLVALANALSAQCWDVSVLTVREQLYERTDAAALEAVDPRVRILRSRAYDTRKHLSIKGRYLQTMALPDTLQSWVLFGLIAGLRQIRRQRPAVILSSYPIASSHLLAYCLHRLTGIPWIADFRDPMAQDGYPSNRAQWKSFKWIEERAAKHARLLVFATDGAMNEYRRRYPQVSEERWAVMSNGFDGERYADIVAAPRAADRPTTLLHSGLIYPMERNPEALFKALGRLQQEGFFNSHPLRLTLRATGHDTAYAPMIAAAGIDQIVSLEPPVPYTQALQEMFDADALLLLQGADCNQQIPAKAYEYLRARKPVLALTDPEGDTARLLADNGVAAIASLYDEDAIADALKNFCLKLQQERFVLPDLEAINRYDRRTISAEFVGHLESVLAKESAA
ncbi:glycosyltransferase [Motiliproteus sediminis]|uniref:glycosyltransferase n=1 Tax=Motiliproteus sediminis TaxID=1468178 RepID=UPI001FEB6ED0|nr:glycosyltransferase [Motiliproteus sediminis]